MRWYEVLWGKDSKDRNDGAWKDPRDAWDPDPDDLTINNAYKTRWIWYHTILGLLMFMAHIILIAILIVLAVKL